MPIKSVKNENFEKQRNAFFSHVTRITQLKNQVPRSKAVLCSPRIDTQTHTRHESDYCGHPFRVSGVFFRKPNQGSAQKRVSFSCPDHSTKTLGSQVKRCALQPVHRQTHIQKRQNEYFILSSRIGQKKQLSCTTDRLQCLLEGDLWLYSVAVVQLILCTFFLLG